jgi:hypothetical protein
MTTGFLKDLMSNIPTFAAAIAIAQNALKWLFTTPVLITFGACVLIFAGTVSSVVVSGEFPDKEQDPVLLFRPDRPSSGSQPQNGHPPDLDAQIQAANCRDANWQ